jgi:hypothetical protein
VLPAASYQLLQILSPLLVLLVVQPVERATQRPAELPRLPVMSRRRASTSVPQLLLLSLEPVPVVPTGIFVEVINYIVGKTGKS